MAQKAIGPTFPAELQAAGLLGLPFAWSPDGTLTFDPAMTPAQVAAVEAVYAAHNPEAVDVAAQAQAALAAGLTITSTASPALNGTYACDASMQAKLGSMFNLIQRAGGAAFPAGLAALPWPDINGTVHDFTAVSDFLNLETAIGDYVLQLDLIITLNSGTLPAATATIS